MFFSNQIICVMQSTEWRNKWLKGTSLVLIFWLICQCRGYVYVIQLPTKITFLHKLCMIICTQLQTIPIFILLTVSSFFKRLFIWTVSSSCKFKHVWFRCGSSAAWDWKKKKQNKKNKVLFQCVHAHASLRFVIWRLMTRIRTIGFY